MKKFEDVQMVQPTESKEEEDATEEVGKEVAASQTLKGRRRGRQRKQPHVSGGNNERKQAKLGSGSCSR